MKHLALLIIGTHVFAADPTAQAGPDRSLAWPAIHADLAGVGTNGSPHWYQVSGPATARLRSDTSAATQAALSQPGTYVFRLCVSGGGKTASDDMTVTVAAPTTLGINATAVDHLNANTVPMPRTGTRMLALNRHDFGIPASIAVPLATRWGYNWMINIDAYTDQKMGDSGWPEYAYAQAWAANPGAYRVTALYQHAVDSTFTAKPTGWPDSAFLRDANGVPIDFDSGTGALYRLSPLAPDTVFTNVGQAIGQAMVQALTRRGMPISAVADQGEWGLGPLGFLWEEYQPGVWRPIWQRDPAVIAAANADPVSKGDLDRFASRQAARQHRLVKEAIYTAASLSADVPWYGYSGTSFSIDRARWGGWSAWAGYLEDSAPWSPFAGEEFYIQGDDWTAVDGGGTPQDYMTRLLNTVSGQRSIQGRSRMVPWISAGGWAPETDPGKWQCPRNRYAGFMKLMFTCGAVGVLQDDYGNDQRIRFNRAIGATPTTQVWGWMDTAHIRALFTHVDDIIHDGELVASTVNHPFQAHDPTTPRKMMAFKLVGDASAWIVARKAKDADRWLVSTFITGGSGRTVAVDIPGPGHLSLQTREAGCVYLIEKDSAGVIHQTWLDEQDPLQPTRLWFSDGPGVLASSAVDAPVAPVITTQPVNRSVTAGQTATFTVVATGTPAPTYQWRKGGTPIAGATTASHTTPATVTGDNGTLFSVVVTNSAGSATSVDATLTVTAIPVAPVITTQPVNRSVTAGQTATFTVVATGTPAPTYQWRKGGTPIAGATTASHTTPATVTSDNGTLFSVVVTNSAGSATSIDATLTVVTQTGPGDDASSSDGNSCGLGSACAMLFILVSIITMRIRLCLNHRGDGSPLSDDGRSA